MVLFTQPTNSPEPPLDAGWYLKPVKFEVRTHHRIIVIGFRIHPSVGRIDFPSSVRMIYAQADRVLVWLGENENNGKEALETIQRLAEDKMLRNSGVACETEKACMSLLKRDWFQRIWVLQEVGVARCVAIICGSVQVNGYAFCEGLSRLDMSFSAQHVGPVIHLIRTAIFRHRHTFGSRGVFSIGGLYGMYRFHKATVKHDMVYALLGLSSDDPNTPKLKPNYTLSWDQVFKQMASYISSGEFTVQSWVGTHTAVIDAKGLILGQIISAHEIPGYSEQSIDICFHDVAQSVGFNEDEDSWEVQSSVIRIQEGDILCIFQGCSKPSIIRLHQNYFILIMVALMSKHDKSEGGLYAESEEEHLMRNSHNFLLAWNIWLTDDEGKDQSKRHMDPVSEPQEASLDGIEKLHGMTCILEGIAVGILNRRDTRDYTGIKKPMRDRGIAMKRLFRQSKTKIAISERIIQLTARDTSKQHRLIDLLVKFQESLLVLQDAVTAARKTNIWEHECYDSLYLIFHHQQHLPLTEEVFRAAAAIPKGYGLDIIKIMLERQQDPPITVTAEVLRAASGNPSFYGIDVIEIMLEHQRGPSITITEELRRAVAENPSFRAIDLIEIMLERQQDPPIIITEDVLKAAAGHRGSDGKEIIRILFEYQEDLPITEDVLKATVGSRGICGFDTIQFLFQHQKNLPITKEVLKVAAENAEWGCEILRVMAKNQKDITQIAPEWFGTATKKEEAFRREEAESDGWSSTTYTSESD
ncbi:hypothetical protein BO71DRAFT_102572 [Aspergillus ellipticus CBS 707.79]|uniref:Heterokaryon incompatibility domain-containing protein n=1 Tax=Aspergillus ellipticus CBS 707.79 TaxID=1448320 RepID=A0A319F0A5_9EURO|nr:hypothetical protein BO71DRAFT_102572 [Aspergillus ellipticus CBS 707.79]